MSPIKIIFAITNLELGGAQTVLLHLLPLLDKKKFAVSLLCLYGGDSDLAGRLRDAGIPVTDLHYRRKRRLDKLLLFYSHLRAHRPHILHGSLFHAVLLSRLLGRLAGVPTILSWRQNVELGAPWRERLNRWTTKLDAGTIAASEAVRQAEIQRAGVQPSRVTVIPNVIDAGLVESASVELRLNARAGLNIPPQTILLGTVGRLHPQKGLPVLLKTMPRLLAAVPVLRLLIVGSGELESELKQLAHRLGLGEAVRFTGYQPNIQRLLPALDIFLLPSLWEGLSLALLEAMAAGLPVVAADVGGTSEAVLHEVTGLLVPPDDEDALLAAILRLISDRDMRIQMGQAGRERIIRHFSAGAAAEKLSRLYLDLLDRGGR